MRSAMKPRFPPGISRNHCIGQIGKISVKSCHEVEWSIEKFCSYTVEDDYCSSPSFTLSGSQWFLRVYPSGETAANSVGWISLRLVKSDCTEPSPARFVFGLKKLDGTVEITGSKLTWFFDKDSTSHGCSRVLERSELQQRQSELLASDSETLTLSCTLWKGTYTEPCGSLDVLSRYFFDLYLSKKGCDATLIVNGEEFSVHKLILSARSPVLATMFEADMKEKRTGLVEIEDCQPETFKQFLKFLYSGKVEDVSCDAFELYKIADKYDVEDLKSECLILIMSSLSVENVLEAAILGSQFNDDALKMKTEIFFNKNYKGIISSSKWDNDFLNENVIVANNLLKSMAKQ